MADLSQLLYTDLIWFIIGAVALVLYFLFRKRIAHHAFFSLDYENFSRDIIIPVIIIFILLSAFRFISGIPLIEGKVTSLFAVLSYVIIGPFFEELFLRGIILGGSFYLSSKLDNKFAQKFFIILGFIIQLFIFVWMHGYLEPVRIIYLSLIGLVYSLLFVFNKREILPSMIAHALTNLLIIWEVFG